MYLAWLNEWRCRGALNGDGMSIPLVEIVLLVASPDCHTVTHTSVLGSNPASVFHHTGIGTRRNRAM